MSKRINMYVKYSTRKIQTQLKKKKGNITGLRKKDDAEKK